MDTTSNGTGIDRRSFMSAGATGLAGAAVTGSSTAHDRVIGANDRINIGVIGCGSRGGAVMKSMGKFMHDENFTFTALCDVWKPNLDKNTLWVKEATGRKPKTSTRYQDLLDMKDIDAVMIMSPDHTHSPMLIAASNAGKDVFCEKPMAMNMAEARDAVDTVRRNGTICQLGTQRRSNGRFMSAARYIQEGNLGKIVTVDLKWNDNSPRWERSFTNVRREDVDWEACQSGAKRYPFHPRRFRCWHLYRDYSLGAIGVLGAHLADLVTWYTGERFPLSAVGFGDHLVWKNREHYDTIIATYKYPGFLMTCEHRFGNKSRRSEAVFYGTQGILTSEMISSEGRIDPKRLEPTGSIYTASSLAGEEIDGKSNRVPLEADSAGVDHNRNWIRAMRTRKDPNATVEDGYSHSVIAMMGLWAADRGKRLKYDTVKRDIVEA